MAKRQLNKVEPHDVAGADAGMPSSVALSRNLWGCPNLALSGTGQTKEFHKVARLNSLEDWRRTLVPLKPRSKAKRNALQSSVHNPPQSRSLATVIDHLDEWEKTVDQFELCDGVLSEADRRTILLKKQPSTVHSLLVPNLWAQAFAPSTDTLLYWIQNSAGATTWPVHQDNVVMTKASFQPVMIGNQQQQPCY